MTNAPDARGCARPGCTAAAAATLDFTYMQRRARLRPLTPEPSPAVYDLCADHAARTRPPHGWELADERDPAATRTVRCDATSPGTAAAGTGMPAVTPFRTAADDGAEPFGAHTVAVLAAALRAVPGPDPAPAPAEGSAAPATLATADRGQDLRRPRAVPAAARVTPPTQLVLGDPALAAPEPARAW